MKHVKEIMSNDAWVAGVRERDSQVLDALRAYLCRSLTAALTGRAGQNDVEDFAQQAMERILDRVDSFRGDSRFTTWASAIAVRGAFAALRRKEWGNQSLDALLAGGGTPASAVGPDGRHAVERSELLAALEVGIATALSERQRAIVLAELRGMPTAVLSDTLGMSTGAIYKMHHDARKKLRIYLEKQGFSAEDIPVITDGREISP